MNVNLRERIRSCPFQTLVALDREEKDLEWLNSYFARYTAVPSLLKRNLPNEKEVEASINGLKILAVSVYLRSIVNSLIRLFLWVVISRNSLG
jgi:hypothetical protein